MHAINVDQANKTADFDIHNEAELDLITRGVSELIRKQELKTVRRSSRDIISQVEIDKLERFKILPTLLQVGQVRLKLPQILDLANAVNEGIVKYEKEVTNNPEDEALSEMKTFLKLLNNVSKVDILKRG